MKIGGVLGIECNNQPILQAVPQEPFDIEWAFNPICTKHERIFAFIFHDILLPYYANVGSKQFLQAQNLLLFTLVLSYEPRQPSYVHVQVEMLSNKCSR